jgi:hypothetical protein
MAPIRRASDSTSTLRRGRACCSLLVGWEKRTSIMAHLRGCRTKLHMISTYDDIWRIRSKRASGASIVASLHRVAAVLLHLVQQRDGDVACLHIVTCELKCRLRGQGGIIERSAALRSRCSHCLFPGLIGCNTVPSSTADMHRHRSSANETVLRSGIAGAPPLRGAQKEAVGCGVGSLCGTGGGIGSAHRSQSHFLRVLIFDVVCLATLGQ